MEPAPIHHGAIRPQGRPRHALVSLLVRVIAIAGFAFAGWIALSTLTDSAHASQSPPHPHHEGRHTTFSHEALAKQLPSFDATPSRALPLHPRHDASAVSQHLAPHPPTDKRQTNDRFESWWAGASRGVEGAVRGVGDRPVGYLQARRHEVFDRKDRAVRDVKKLADAAGVPQVRIPDVRPDVPIVGRLVQDVAGSPSVLGGELLPKTHEGPAAADESQTAKAVPGDTAGGSDGWSVAPKAFAGDAGDPGVGHCPRCGGDRQAPAPGPVLPSGQDEPRSGAGGHPLAPVADLRNGGYPAAQAAMDPAAFHRTALTDLSAPGGPSVVPD